MRFEPEGMVAYIGKTMYMQPCIRVRMRFEPEGMVAYIGKTTTMYMQVLVNDRWIEQQTGIKTYNSSCSVAIMTKNVFWDPLTKHNDFNWPYIM